MAEAPAPAVRQGQSIPRLAASAVALVLLILTAAAFLRLSQAGLDCPEWPECYGMLETNARSLQEAAPGVAVRLAHRIAALAAGALVLALGWQVMARGPRCPGELAVVAGMLALLLFLAVLGRWSSLSRIPAVAVGNLLGGSALLALGWLLWIRQRPAPPGTPRPLMAALAWTALAAVLLQSGLGVLVSAKYAALACGGWLSCTGASPEHLPQAFTLFANPAGVSAGALATLQWAHHIGAGAVLVLVAAVSFALAGTPGGRRIAAALIASALAQIALGAGAIRLGHPLAVVMAHNLVANLMLLALVSATHRLSRGRRRAADMPA